MYNVKSGEQYAKLTITDAETVKFSSRWDVFAVKGEGITVKLDTLDSGDGVYSTDDLDGCVIVAHHRGLDTLYLIGSGSVQVWAGASVVDCPFKKQSKGGGGSDGDGTHYKGTTTTAIENGSTTNPIVIDGESYTAVFGDVVVYNYTEFVFDGTTWSEFGRPFDTTPTSGSMNAVTSDGIYKVAHKGSGAYAVIVGGNAAYAPGDYGIATGYKCYARGKYSIAGGGESNVATAARCGIALGDNCNSTENYGIAIGNSITANQSCLAAFGRYNSPRTGDLFNIGKGTNDETRSNIVEVNSTSLNVNGDILQNGLPITAAVYGIQEVTLWENSDTVNPQTITISQPYTDFSELIIVHETVVDDLLYYDNSVLFVSEISVGDVVRFWFNQNTERANYVITNSTTFTKVTTTGNQYVSKIIGRRYTRVDPQGNPEVNYSTTERKIGKWIDGSDLYQRTFVVTGLTNGSWNNNVLGTSGISIQDVQGYVDWLYDNADNVRTSLDYFRSDIEFVSTVVTSTKSDVDILPKIALSGYTVDKAVITIKYTKTQAQPLSANMTQIATPTEEVTDTPDVEEDDVR